MCLLGIFIPHVLPALNTHNAQGVYFGQIHQTSYHPLIRTALLWCVWTVSIPPSVPSWRGPDVAWPLGEGAWGKRFTTNRDES